MSRWLGELAHATAVAAPASSDGQAGAALLYTITIGAVLGIFLIVLLLLTVRRALRTPLPPNRPTRTAPDASAESARRLKLEPNEGGGDARP